MPHPAAALEDDSGACDAAAPVTTKTPAKDGRAQAYLLRKLANYEGQINAIRKSHAVVEFEMDGTVIDANENFLDALGYAPAEIKGRHHRTLVEPAYGSSDDYARFWSDLNQGRFQRDEYKRIHKSGKAVWFQGTYNPIFSASGKLVKVVTYAIDVTAVKMQSADCQAQLQAIARSQAIMEFSLDGTVLTANESFLAALGYSLAEVKGRHHRMFVDPAFAASPDYARFWRDLTAGKFQAAEYKRIGAGGREVWMQATYTPVADLNGEPFKIVKYATDVTAAKVREERLTLSAG